VILTDLPRPAADSTQSSLSGGKHAPTLGARVSHYRRLLLGFLGGLLYLMTEGHSKSAVAVGAAYVRIFFRYLILTKALRRQVRRERVFGFDIGFADHGAFVALFEEIFVKEAYYCETRAGEQISAIDGGANIGLALLYLKWRHPESEIVAFEPDAATFALLEQNVRNNGLAGVTLRQAALAANDGSISFFTDGAGSLVANTVAPRGPAAASIVRAERLSPFVPDRLSILKLDVEGAEGHVMHELEASGALARVEYIALEFHHNLPSQRDALSTILALLERNGFEYVLQATHAARWDIRRFQDVSVLATRRLS
jgi:FkbM family methyltransferase